MARAWRLHFSPQDVAFLFIPERLHGAARSFFDDAESENASPAYFCPYVDPKGNMARIQAAFSAVAPTPTVEAPEPAADDDECEYCGALTIGGICIACGNLTMP